MARARTVFTHAESLDMEHLSLVFCKTGIPQRQERRGVSDDLSDQRKEFTDKGTWECIPVAPQPPVSVKNSRASEGSA